MNLDSEGRYMTRLEEENKALKKELRRACRLLLTTAAYLDSGDYPENQHQFKLFTKVKNFLKGNKYGQRKA